VAPVRIGRFTSDVSAAVAAIAASASCATTTSWQKPSHSPSFCRISSWMAGVTAGS
jgi:hypothetical protein